ncbi:MAG: hypothetical protein DU429_05970 [Candidatus Tokpelaia sp.]|nr:MAG: hypothetical protein DU429_05970 [Candidatus Tokpelaia sp.]KAA6206543.1 MAG: hypothetical protein DU430_00130 [Candidatus Tokpelaia sp.]KAA6405840.1 hypothetical protein DPQ22_02395 [Candidatus Tokpelaia sp.]
MFLPEPALKPGRKRQEPPPLLPGKTYVYKSKEALGGFPLSRYILLPLLQSGMIFRLPVNFPFARKA